MTLDAVMVRHRLPVRICLCHLAVHQPDRRRVHRKLQHSRIHLRAGDHRGHDLHAVLP